MQSLSEVTRRASCAGKSLSLNFYLWVKQGTKDFLEPSNHFSNLVTRRTLFLLTEHSRGHPQSPRRSATAKCFALTVGFGENKTSDHGRKHTPQYRLIPGDGTPSNREEVTTIGRGRATLQSRAGDGTVLVFRDSIRFPLAALGEGGLSVKDNLKQAPGSRRDT